MAADGGKDVEKEEHLFIVEGVQIYIASMEVSTEVPPKAENWSKIHL